MSDDKLRLTVAGNRTTGPAHRITLEARDLAARGYTPILTKPGDTDALTLHPDGTVAYHPAGALDLNTTVDIDGASFWARKAAQLIASTSQPA